ncbi:hypothetical protein N7444_000917 [Penicillium canescens]|nr:hypothetical protein N7444_000917 [Penicillium canescens]
MAKDEESDVNHHNFLQWALFNGIQINGVAPVRFPGRGMGIIATRTIEANEIMIAVPVSTMLTIDCVPREFVDRFPHEASIHGILAAFLTHGDAGLLDYWAAWRKIWPSRQHFQESLPVLWSESPGDTYQNVLGKQQKRLHDAWEHVLSVFPTTDWSLFSYHWLILNTRSFYYVSPGKEPPDDWNDAIGLVPFGDYLNHADNAPCEVVFDGQMSTFRATARHGEGFSLMIGYTGADNLRGNLEKGDEVFMSYGSHPNDYLFVEYGFFLDRNESDAVYLDDVVFQDITFDDKEALRAHGYYGHYEINSSGPSLGVGIVASFKCMTREDWEKCVLGLPSSGCISEEATEWVRKWVKTYWEESLLAINGLEGKDSVKGVVWSSKDPLPSLKDRKVATLLRRWIQIRDICKKTLDTLA